MSVDDIVCGDKVLIRAGTRPINLDEVTLFNEDVVGTAVMVSEMAVTVNIPDYCRLRTYRKEDVGKICDEYQE